MPNGIDSTTLSKKIVAMRKHKDSMEELFELLENKQVLSEHFDMKQYRTFCEAYIIALLEQYVPDIDIREPMLASFQLLEDYDRLRMVRDRRIRYSERAATTNKLISSGWADPNDSLEDIEDAEIEKLVSRLMNDVLDDKKEQKPLGLASKVIKQLKEQYPNGLPAKLPLPKPRYKEQDKTEAQDVKPDGASAQESNPSCVIDQSTQINAPEVHAYSGATASNATVVKNYIKVEVTTPATPIEGATEQSSSDTARQVPLQPLPNSSFTPIPPPATLPEDSGPKNSKKFLFGTILVCYIFATIWFVIQYLPGTSRQVNEILVSEEDISLKPNERYQLKVAILPNEAADAPLSYVSSDPSIVTISPSGMLQASVNHAVGGTQTADITIQAESGATKLKSVTVEFAEDGYNAPEDDINDFTPSFRVEQRMRLVGTEEWLNCVEDAKPGDKIEVRIQYINISDETQRNVMIKDILPNNLRYIFGTTVLTNGSGTLPDFGQDALFTTGVNIGHYKPGINAYIDFTAEVIGNGLPEGSNTLVSWSQCCVNQVTLQDYAAVQLYM